MGCGNSSVAPKSKWDILDERIPYQRTKEKLEIRKVLFNKFDRSHSKSLTMEDCLIGCQDELRLGEFCPNDLARVNAAAFNSSHLLRTMADGTDGVDPSEFRLYLVFLRDNMHYSSIFNVNDKSGEGKLTLEEFVNAAHDFEEYGVPITDPTETFDEINKADAGHVTFPEFCEWVSCQEINYDKRKMWNVKRKTAEARNRACMERISVIRSAIPTGYSPEERKRREALFHKYIKGNNNQLSVNDCLNGSKKYLQLDRVVLNEDELDEINNGAFHTAKNAPGSYLYSDYLVKKEFYMYLVALRDHCELNEIFNNVYKGEGSNDRKINMVEFVLAAPQIREWGAPIDDPEVAFHEMDLDNKGTVDFQEFAYWACKNNIEIEKTEQVIQAEREADEDLTEECPTMMDPMVAQQQSEPLKATRNNSDTADVVRCQELWGNIRQRFPLGRTKAEGKKRDILFDLFDRSKSETLDEKECLAGARDVLGLDNIINNLTEVNKQAYESARSYDPTSDTVDRVGFRLYLVYLREYLELHNMFDDFDASENKISLEQFREAIPKLEEWGLESPEKTFDMIDHNKCGTIDFDEFAGHVTEPRLKMERDDINKKEAARKAAVAEAERGEATMEEKEAARAEAEIRKVMWEEVKLRLPRSKNDVENEQRNELFKKFDVSNNGFITFKECCDGCYTILKLREFYNNIEPIVLRSFNRAANVRGKIVDKEPVTGRLEFRIFLVFIFDYLELFVKFEEMKFSVDRLIGFDIFKACVPVFESWGISVPDPVAAFDEIDVLDVGMVDFDSFADWGVAQHMKAQNVNIVINKPKIY